MPKILVVADTHEDAPEVLMNERVAPELLESEHYGAQLLERVRWATEDAAEVEERSA
jgi:hypothetical protein